MKRGTTHRRRLLIGVSLLVLSPLLLGFLCFPLVAPTPSGVAPTPAAMFAPTPGMSVLNTSPGAVSGLAATLSFPAGSTLAAGVVFDIPAGWSVTGGGSVADGTAVGSIEGFMTIDNPQPTGLTPFGCNTTVRFDPNHVDGNGDPDPTDISLLDATLDSSPGNQVAGSDEDNDGTPDVIDDDDPANGLPDGVDRYPAFLANLPLGTPFARYFGHTEAAGISDLYVNIVVTELAPGGPYRVTTIVNDPTSPPESATNRFCAPQSLTLHLSGSSAGQTLFQNPKAAGAYTFEAALASEFDHDNDGASNGFDNCPLVPNASQADADEDYVGDACETDAVQNFDVDGDGLENGYDNCLFVSNPAQEDGDFDDLGDDCDPNNGVPNGAYHLRRCSDPVGIGQSDPGPATCVAGMILATPTPKSLSGDTDGDTIPNGTDLDDDDDGCSDLVEVGPDAVAGGRRNPHNPWDFFDPDGSGLVDLFNDVFAVAGGFGLSPEDQGYGAHLDRSPPPLPGKDPNDPANNEPWDVGPPDATIDLFVDIFGVAAQFGHSCL